MIQYIDIISYDSESVLAQIVDERGNFVADIPEILGDIEDYDDAVYAAKCEAERLGYSIRGDWSIHRVMSILGKKSAKGKNRTREYYQNLAKKRWSKS